MPHTTLPRILLPLAVLGLAGCAGLFGPAQVAAAPPQSVRCEAAVLAMGRAQPTAQAGREFAAPDGSQAFAACMQSAGWQPVQAPVLPVVTTMVVSAGPDGPGAAAPSSRRSLGLEVMLMAVPGQARGHARGAPGLLVMEVLPGGAAQSAGLRRGDILLAFGGTPVAAIEAVQATLANARRGSRLAVELWRDQQPMVATLVF